MDSGATANINIWYHHQYDEPQEVLHANMHLKIITIEHDSQKYTYTHMKILLRMFYFYDDQ